MASRKILAVDDSVSIRKSISFILGQEGYEVVEAENGQDGMSKLDSDKFGLIITDINMPVMDGIQLLLLLFLQLKIKSQKCRKERKPVPPDGL